MIVSALHAEMETDLHREREKEMAQEGMAVEEVSVVEDTNVATIAQVLLRLGVVNTVALTEEEWTTTNLEEKETTRTVFLWVISHTLVRIEI